MRRAHVLGVADYSSVVCGTALMKPVSILIFHGGSSARTQWGVTMTASKAVAGITCQLLAQVQMQYLTNVQSRNRSTIDTKTRDIFLGLTFVSKGDDRTIDSAVVEDEEGVQSET